jgi:hypothetical protein
MHSLTGDEYGCAHYTAWRRIGLSSICARKAGHGNDRVWKAWKAMKPAPHPSQGLDGWIYVFSCPLNSNHSPRKGLVTDVSGRQRNACPGTLTSNGFAFLISVSVSAILSPQSIVPTAERQCPPMFPASSRPINRDASPRISNMPPTNSRPEIKAH